MSYETKQNEIAKEMQLLSGRLESFTKSKEYSKGYSDCQKEYEEKLRWIPVEEKLPDISKESDIYSDVVTVREHDYYSPLAALYSHEYKQWISYPNSVVLSNVTEWRRLRNATNSW